MLKLPTVEINLNDIVTLSKEEIEEEILDRLYESVKTSLETHLTEVVKKTIEERTKVIFDAMFPDLLTRAYKETDSWGKVISTWTLEERLRDCLKTVFTLKNLESGYGSERNAFTTEIRRALNEKMREFKASALKKIDDDFVEACINEAQKRLRERLKL